MISESVFFDLVPECESECDSNDILHKTWMMIHAVQKYCLNLKPALSKLVSLAFSCFICKMRIVIAPTLSPQWSTLLKILQK